MVEVRQPTLGGAGRGWGPAANTGLGWPWLRSGSQHLARMAVVEVRRQEEARRRRRRRRRRKEEAAALIKSNNPHLAGGEKDLNIGRVIHGKKSMGILISGHIWELGDINEWIS